MNREGSITNSISTFAPPDEHTIENDDLIVLTRQELDSIFQAAINARFEDLVNENAILKEEIKSLTDKIEELTKRVGELRKDIFQLQNALDVHFEEDAMLRRRVTAIETRARRPTGSKLAARADALRALLLASGGKIMLDDARERLDLSRQQFSNLLNTMRGEIATRPLHTNKRKKVIYLKNSSREL